MKKIESVFEGETMLQVRYASAHEVLFFKIKYSAALCVARYIATRTGRSSCAQKPKCSLISGDGPCLSTCLFSVGI
jgi:hypothetical protein